MSATANGVAIEDAGTPFEVRNTVDGTDRSAPKYEWSGELQSLVTADGKTGLLDPVFYLLNKTDFIGDAAAGKIVLNTSCAECHGLNASGEADDEFPSVYAPALNAVGWNKFSREGLRSAITAPDHDGAVYFNKLTATQQDDLFARIKSLGGVPGYYLQQGSGSVADVTAFSSLNPGAIKLTKGALQYKVLLIRKLNTGNADDIAIKTDGSQTYNFSVFITDNDEINKVGTVDQKLIFK
jgi:hypothetical protein